MELRSCSEASITALHYANSQKVFLSSVLSPGIISPVHDEHHSKHYTTHTVTLSSSIMQQVIHVFVYYILILVVCTFLRRANACLIIISLPQPSGPTSINGSLLSSHGSIAASVLCFIVQCSNVKRLLAIVVVQRSVRKHIWHKRIRHISPAKKQCT
jgi:hypothetical protein